MSRIRYLRAKILEHNVGSVKLFSERLGFDLERRVEVFGEIWYLRDLNLTEAKTPYDTDASEKYAAQEAARMENWCRDRQREAEALKLG